MTAISNFLSQLFELISNVVHIIQTTANNIDSITFNDTVFATYLGYARYVMGDPLYSLFTTVILIAIGISLWSYLLKGIGMLKNLLPY